MRRKLLFNREEVMISLLKLGKKVVWIAAAISMLASCGGGGGTGGVAVMGAGLSGVDRAMSSTSTPMKAHPTQPVALPVAQHADGIGQAARFVDPTAMTGDHLGNQYVIDKMPDGATIIRKITPEGSVTTLTAATGGSGDNLLRWSGPLGGIAVDGQGVLYVSNTYDNTIEKIDATGTVSVLAGKTGESGYQDDVGDKARLFYPSAIAANADGTIYFTDSFNMTVREITPEGAVTTFAGTATNGSYTGRPGGDDGVGAGAQFSGPQAIAIDGQKNLYVYENGRVRKITSARVVTTLAGAYTALLPTYLDGQGTAARFGEHGAALSVDANGHVYVADVGNNVIRKISPDGNVATFAGAQYPRWYRNSDGYNVEEQMFYADGAAQEARFGSLAGISVAGTDAVYVVDRGNFVVRKVDAQAAVSTWVGTRSKPLFSGSTSS